MRQLRAAGQGPGPLVLALCGLALVLGVACESLNGLMGLSSPAPAGSGKSAPEPLPLGSWKTGWLQCNAGRCERWYEIDIRDEGTLKVDLYAPVGSALPDCEMELQTPEGEGLPATTGRVRTQRRLRHSVEPATYYLHVTASGANQDRFDYDVFAQVDPDESGGSARPRTPPGATHTTTRPTPPSSLQSKPQSTPQSTPQSKPSSRPEIPLAVLPDDESDAEGPGPDVEDADEGPALEAEAPGVPAPQWIVAEVLDVEEEAGEPSAVMIEAGAPDGVREGMRGELVDGETVIGEIEVTDVYKSGSRARLLGPLSAPVSFDTVSRIPVPPESSPNGK